MAHIQVFSISKNARLFPPPGYNQFHSLDVVSCLWTFKNPELPSFPSILFIFQDLGSLEDQHQP